MEQITQRSPQARLGAGVTEHDPDGKAAEEVRQLWQWIKKKMEGKVHGEAAAVA